MNHKLAHARLLMLPLAAIACIPATALAQNDYMGLEGGFNFLRNQRVDQDGTTLASLGFKHGYVGGLTVGSVYLSGWRPELELAYRSNDLQSAVTPAAAGGVLGGATGGGSTGGREYAATAMFNLWYDLNASSGFFSIVHPYVGGGVGGALVGLRSATVNGSRWNDDDRMLFGYQGGAGVGVDLARGFRLSLDYRFLQTDRGRFDTGAGNGDPATLRYTSHTAMLSLKFLIDNGPSLPPLPPEPVAVVPVAAVPPPPPPPAPPATPPCQAPQPGQAIELAGCKPGDSLVLHGVHFEFNRANLTADAKTVLDSVAAALQAHPAITVELDGHTDGKGTAAYNQSLSERRAAATKQYLVDRGVDAGRIATRGYGKSSPVADNGTDEGRELNRRVELKIIHAGAADNASAQ